MAALSKLAPAIEEQDALTPSYYPAWIWDGSMSPAEKTQDDFYNFYIQLLGCGWSYVRGWRHDLINGALPGQWKNHTESWYWQLLQHADSRTQLLILKDTGWGWAPFTVVFSQGGLFVGNVSDVYPTATDSVEQDVVLRGWLGNNNGLAFYLAVDRHGWAVCDQSGAITNFAILGRLYSSVSYEKLPNRTVLYSRYGIASWIATASIDNTRVNLGVGVPAGLDTNSADLEGDYRCHPLWVCTVSGQHLGYIRSVYITGVGLMDGQVVNSPNCSLYNKWIIPVAAPKSSTSNVYMVESIAGYGSDNSAPDTTPPTFAGITAVTAISSSELRVQWAAGSDDRSAQADLLYHVHYSITPAATFQTRIVSAPGATSLVVGGLSASTTYYVKVRCADESGNIDANEVELSATTEAASASDKVSPVIVLVSPALGEKITRITPVVVEVTDNVGLDIVPIFCNYKTTYAKYSTYVYDGEKLHPSFSNSIIETISGGFRYTIIPNDGWVSDPTIALDPVDTSGNLVGGVTGGVTWGDGRLWGESGLYWE